MHKLSPGGAQNHEDINNIDENIVENEKFKELIDSLHNNQHFKRILMADNMTDKKVLKWIQTIVNNDEILKAMFGSNYIFLKEETNELKNILYEGLKNPPKITERPGFKRFLHEFAIERKLEQIRKEIQTKKGDLLNTLSNVGLSPAMQEEKKNFDFILDIKETCKLFKDVPAVTKSNFTLYDLWQKRKILGLDKDEQVLKDTIKKIVVFLLLYDTDISKGVSGVIIDKKLKKELKKDFNKYFDYINNKLEKTDILELLKKNENKINLTFSSIEKFLDAKKLDNKYEDNKSELTNTIKNDVENELYDALEMRKNDIIEESFIDRDFGKEYTQDAIVAYKGKLEKAGKSDVLKSYNVNEKSIESWFLYEVTENTEQPFDKSKLVQDSSYRKEIEDAYNKVLKQMAVLSYDFFVKDADRGKYDLRGDVKYVKSWLAQNINLLNSIDDCVGNTKHRYSEVLHKDITQSDIESLILKTREDWYYLESNVVDSAQELYESGGIARRVGQNINVDDKSYKYINGAESDMKVVCQKMDKDSINAYIIDRIVEYFQRVLIESKAKAILKKEGWKGDVHVIKSAPTSDQFYGSDFTVMFVKNGKIDVAFIDAMVSADMVSLKNKLAKVSKKTIPYESYLNMTSKMPEIEMRPVSKILDAYDPEYFYKLLCDFMRDPVVFSKNYIKGEELIDTNLQAYPNSMIKYSQTMLNDEIAEKIK